MKILILAGGTGKRLWPVSRKNNPKQFKPILGQESLLKATYGRLLKGYKPEDIFISVNSFQADQVKKELKVKQSQLIVEPIKRDTAGAIGLASFILQKKFPKETIATVNSDHFIKNEKEFLRVLKTAGKAVDENPSRLLLIGVKPNYPETGYGYIKLNGRFKKIGKDTIFKVAGFKEKPDQKTAKKYLASSGYLWNPAYFVFKPELMIELFKKYLPKNYRILKTIQNDPRRLKTDFKKLNKISIDYGIMEKAGRMICLPANFDWLDVGHWRTVQEALAKNSADNVVLGEYINVDSRGNLAYSYSGKLIATVGIEDTIIIDTGDVLLVCPKNRAQEVKELVKELERKKLNKYL